MPDRIEVPGPGEALQNPDVTGLPDDGTAIRESIGSSGETAYRRLVGAPMSRWEMMRLGLGITASLAAVGGLTGLIWTRFRNEKAGHIHLPPAPTATPNPEIAAKEAAFQAMVAEKLGNVRQVYNASTGQQFTDDPLGRNYGAARSSAIIEAWNAVPPETVYPSVVDHIPGLFSRDAMDRLVAYCLVARTDLPGEPFLTQLITTHPLAAVDYLMQRVITTTEARGVGDENNEWKQAVEVIVKNDHLFNREERGKLPKSTWQEQTMICADALLRQAAKPQPAAY